MHSLPDNRCADAAQADEEGDGSAPPTVTADTEDDATHPPDLDEKDAHGQRASPASCPCGAEPTRVEDDNLSLVAASYMDTIASNLLQLHKLDVSWLRECSVRSLASDGSSHRARDDPACNPKSSTGSATGRPDGHPAVLQGTEHAVLPLDLYAGEDYCWRAALGLRLR